VISPAANAIASVTIELLPVFGSIAPTTTVVVVAPSTLVVPVIAYLPVFNILLISEIIQL
jgi:hypothetical protein